MLKILTIDNLAKTKDLVLICQCFKKRFYIKKILEHIVINRYNDLISLIVNSDVSTLSMLNRILLNSCYCGNTVGIADLNFRFFGLQTNFCMLHT